MIIYVKLNQKSLYNQRRFPICFEFYINPPYPKEPPVVLCKSHFCFPSLFDNRNFGKSLIKKWSSSNHIEQIVQMIQNIPFFISKFENDISQSLFYYDGEYSYTFTYNVNDFVLNGENYLYKVKIITTSNNNENKNNDNLAFLVLTDIQILLLKPDSEEKNKATLFYLANIIDITALKTKEISSGNSIKEENEVLVQLQFKDYVALKFLYFLQMKKDVFDFVNMMINQRNKKIEKVFELYYPNNNFDSTSSKDIEKLKRIIAIREKDLNNKENEFFVSKNLMELYQKMIEIYSMNDDDTYKEYVQKFQGIVQKFSK